MEPLTWMLAALAFGLLLVNAVLLVWALRKGRTGRPDEAALTGTLAASLRQLGLAEDLGRIRQTAADMAATTTELARVFSVSQQRGALGELQLEKILSDQVPADRLRIRQAVPLLGTPDAAIQTREGLLCIDSKFPLEKYRDLVALPEAQRAAPTRAFLRDVRGHLDVVRGKYVRPDAGTLAHAVAFIPSEAVYTFIHQSDASLASEYARHGVLLASPSTLTSHVALLLMGVRAEALTERAKLVEEALHRLDREFGAVRETWDTLRKHLKNAGDQAVRLEQVLEQLDAAYRRARRLDVAGDKR